MSGKANLKHMTIALLEGSDPSYSGKVRAGENMTMRHAVISLHCLHASIFNLYTISKGTEQNQHDFFCSIASFLWVFIKHTVFMIHIVVIFYASLSINNLKHVYVCFLTQQFVLKYNRSWYSSSLL